MNSIGKKLQLKQGQSLCLINAPASFADELSPLPDGLKLISIGEADHVHLFASQEADLIARLPAALSHLKNDGIFWIMYPKKSSGIVSDLSMMSSWAAPERFGYRPVASASVNSMWTAIRFKPLGSVKPSGLAKDEIRASLLGKYLDVDNKRVTLPEELSESLSVYPGALKFFHSLSWTNRKEYLIWILTAKQEETRQSRIQKTIEMLRTKKKNPTHK